MPGGAWRQLISLEQHDVSNSILGEVIESGTADHTPADDDNIRWWWQYTRRRRVVCFMRSYNNNITNYRLDPEPSDYPPAVSIIITMNWEETLI